MLHEFLCVLNPINYHGDAVGVLEDRGDHNQSRSALRHKPQPMLPDIAAIELMAWAL